MSTTSYRILTSVTCIILLTSVFGSVYLLQSWLKKRKSNKHELLDDYIAYMSFSELLLALLYFIFWINPTMDWHWMSQISHTSCVMLAALNQFLNIITTTFNFGLSLFIFYPIIRGIPMIVIEQRKTIHLIFIFGISFICTIFPFFNDHYGFADNDQDKYGLAAYQCWISPKDPNYYLFVYLPTAIYVLFAFCLMVYAQCKVNNEHYKILIDQLTWYTFAFIWVWGAGIINRIYMIFISSTAPFWLSCIRMVCEASMGSVRALIWWRYLKKNERCSNVDDINHKESLVSASGQYTLQSVMQSNNKSTIVSSSLNTFNTN
eukprot:456881_1